MNTNNKLSRREFIRATGTACAAFLMAGTMPGLLNPALAAEEKGEDIKDVLKKYFGDRKIETGHVDIKAPIIAENGAVVPITVISDLPMTPDDYVKRIYIFAEGNINPFTAGIELSPANGKPELALRIKMRKTSNVRAVLETSKGKLYEGIKSVKVTIGGCGG
ncbi:MAG: thiosulfate oxidation carrier protein SoxY [Thermodesulfovibrionales bacterium]